MLQRPLFLIAIAFAIGIVLTGALGIPAAIGLAALIFGVLCAASRRAFGLALLFIVAAVGLARYDLHISLPPNDVSTFARSHVSGIEGRISSDVDLREDRALFQLDVHAVHIGSASIPATGSVMVTYYKPKRLPDWTPPDYGDVILIRSYLSRPSGSSNPGAMSWRDYLARQRIYVVTYIRRPSQVKLLGSGEANSLTALALKVKRKVEDRITGAMPADEAAVVIGMDLGTYTVLPPRLLMNFQRTGTMHLLAASGFNCAVLIAVFGFILVKLGWFSRRTTSVLLILILIFYMLMVGAKPSIVRATVMASLFLLGRVLNRPSDSINLLFGAAIAILAINPADLFDVGFQLSFAAVLALIVALPVIQEVAKPWGLGFHIGKKRFGWLSKTTTFVLKDAWLGLTATTAATLGTLPITAHYFNYVSIVSVAVNAIVAAAVLPIFVVGLLLPIFSWVPGIGTALSFAGTMITRFALGAINSFGEMPYSCISVKSPGIAGIAGYYILLGAVLWYANSRVSKKQRTGAS